MVGADETTELRQPPHLFVYYRELNCNEKSISLPMTCFKPFKTLLTYCQFQFTKIKKQIKTHPGKNHEKDFFLVIRLLSGEDTGSATEEFEIFEKMNKKTHPTKTTQKLLFLVIRSSFGGGHWFFNGRI